MRRLLSLDEFAKLSEVDRRDPSIGVNTVSVDQPEFGESGRLVNYIFSTSGVGRDLHTVAPDAWQTENFNRNPVFLWVHDDSEPPIGRVINIGDVNGKLRGTVEYTDRDLNPFGDMIYRMVKARYINAVSTSWMPLAWTISRDKERPGGVDFKSVDLLEISQVPIPALADALATARKAGIDTAPMFRWAEKLLDTDGLIAVPRTELEILRRAAKMPATNRAADSWKVGAPKDLPIEESDSWDGPAAEKSIFEWAGGDEFSSEKARKGFLVYNSAKPDVRSSYKLPIAHVVDGELKVPHGAIKAAASRLPQTDIPEDVKTRAEGVLNSYKKRAGIGQDDDGDSKEERALKAKHARALARAPKVPTFKRGLYELSSLCCLLEHLGYCHNASEYEAALEGDGSEVPAMLGEALGALGEALKAMATEEVDELLAQHDGDGGEDEEAEIETRALSAEQRAYIAAGKTLRARAWRAGIAIARAGKALSASNQDKLEEAQGHHERSMKHSRALKEHHEAVTGHLEEARAAHGEATDTLKQIGEHVRAAQGDPTNADHLKRAAKAHADATEHMGAIADAHSNMADRHADVGDSHGGMERSVKSAARCVRGVLSGAVTSEADEPGADATQESEVAKAEKARGLEKKERERRAARARELAKQHREPITLD